MDRRCETLYCYNTPQAGRKKCQKCRDREWKQLNPLAHSYNRLKSNAKRRGKPFALSKGYWKQFCAETNYLELRGLGAEDMTVDCNDDYVGYVDGGITMKTRSVNSREGKKGKPPPYRPEGVPF